MRALLIIAAIVATAGAARAETIMYPWRAWSDAERARFGPHPNVTRPPHANTDPNLGMTTVEISGVTRRLPRWMAIELLKQELAR